MNTPPSPVHPVRAAKRIVSMRFARNSSFRLCDCARTPFAWISSRLRTPFLPLLVLSLHVRLCPRARTLRLLDGFAGNGRRFRHGSGLLSGFPQALCGADFADLGKHWRCVTFQAEFACKTAQKSQVALASLALRRSRFDDSRINTFALIFAVQNT